MARLPGPAGLELSAAGLEQSPPGWSRARRAGAEPAGLELNGGGLELSAGGSGKRE